MKKFKYCIIGSLFLYLVLALFAGYTLYNQTNQQQHAFRVEINRIMHQIESQNTWKIKDMSSYQYIKQLEFLDVTNTNQVQIQNFYIDNLQRSIRIRPWFHQDQLKGYIKFIYELPKVYTWRTIVMVELSLALLEAVFIVVFYNLKRRIIRQISQVDAALLEFSKGHFKGEIKQDKHSYLSSFQLGISQLKDHLEVSRKRQLELEKEKKQLLLSLSHEIKTPLNLIKLYEKALSKGLYKDDVAKLHAIKKIGEKTDEIENYVDEIMKTSREDILDIQVEVEEFYLHTFVEKVCAIYQEQCTLRMIDLQIAPYDDAIVKGDFSRLQEVMENLFENAFKYGDGMRIELSICVEEYHHLIRFYNTGKPVSDQDFNHVFESFYRGGNSLGKQGSGLGLYICREIMRKMHGSIYAEKTASGMAFILVLP